jgi:hypothetical protein
MANYIIIGGDNKEYGPVSEADVRQWIVEGRLNGESRVKAESDAEFRTLTLFPEFAGALRQQSSPLAPPGVSPVPAPDDFAERDYELDIGGCISRGWEVYKENFGTIFGAFIIAGLVVVACAGAVNVVTFPFAKSLLHGPVALRLAYGYVFSAVLALVSGPIMGGLFLVILKRVRGWETSLGEVFAGFQQSYLHLFLGSLIVSLINGVCMLPFQYVWQTKTGPLFEQMQTMQNDPSGMQNLLPQLSSAMGSSLPVFLVCMIPVTFFTVSLQFTLPLIIDKQMTFQAALGASWRMVLRHWWLVFGLTIVAGLVSVVGVLGCCIGVLFTMPLGITAMMIAYETIFGVRKS